MCVCVYVLYTFSLIPTDAFFSGTFAAATAELFSLSLFLVVSQLYTEFTRSSRKNRRAKRQNILNSHGNTRGAHYQANTNFFLALSPLLFVNRVAYIFSQNSVSPY